MWEATHIRHGAIDDTSSAINHHREGHVVHRLRKDVPTSPRAFIGQGGGDRDLTLAVKGFESDGASMRGNGAHGTILMASGDER